MTSKGKSRVRLSFRTKLFVALALVIASLLWLAMGVFERETTNRIENRFQTEYQDLTKLIDTQFSTKLNDLKNNLNIFIESNAQLKTTLTTAAISTDSLGLSGEVSEKELLKDVHLRLASSVPFTRLAKTYDWLMFLNPDGSLLYSTVADKAYAEDLSQNELIRPLLQEDIELSLWPLAKQDSMQSYFPKGQEHYLVFALPILLNEQFYGLVLVGESLARAHAWLPKISQTLLFFLSENEVLAPKMQDIAIDWSQVKPKDINFETMPGFFLAKNNILQHQGASLDIGFMKNLEKETYFLKQLRYLSLYVLLGGILLSLIISFWLARGITKPVLKLSGVAREIGQGNFDIEPDIHTGDEFEALGVAFHDMATGLKERDFLKNTFECYVSKEVAEAVMKDPRLLELGGERRDITVLFVDLAGFTQFSEGVVTDDVFTLLNEFFGVVTQSVLQHNGTLNQYQGDAVLAFWGAPLPQEDHAKQALAAALSMQKALNQLSQDWQARGLPKMGFRIGMNTGEAMVGNVGTPERFNFTAHGDHVNLASRIEGANKFYGTSLIVTEDTWHEANHTLGRKVDQVQVVGRNEPIWLVEPWIESQKQLKNDYENALKVYQSGDFSQAQSLFAKILENHPEDGPSQAMQERCASFTTEPPQNWQGVYRLLGK